MERRDLSRLGTALALAYQTPPHTHQSSPHLRDKTQERWLLGLLVPTDTHAHMHTGVKTHGFYTNFTLKTSETVSESCFANDSRMHCETPCGIRVLSSVPACTCDEADCVTRRPRRWSSHSNCPGHRRLPPPHSEKQKPTTCLCWLRRSGRGQRPHHTRKENG